MITIPILNGALFLAGGQWNKWYRWGMGAPVAILCFIKTGHAAAFLLIPSYWIATSAFPYGEKSWLNFLGEKLKFAACGLAFGLASIPALGIFGGIENACLSAIAWAAIKELDDRNILKNPYVEIARGFFGSIRYIWL